MDFRDVLARRRMVRNYTNEPVDQEVVQRIAAAALRAPSAGFSQGLAIVVVTDPATRAEIAQSAGEAAYVAQGFDPWISQAPVHLVVCISEEAYHHRYRRPDKLEPDGTEISWPVPYWWVDAGAGLMAILLAAVDEGLAAGFLGVHAIRDLKGLLGVPEQYAVVGVVTVGYPAPDRRSRSLDLGRRHLSEVVHWDHWTPRDPPGVL
ncbi:MAG: nitroreductase family protein [Acidimicrobiia bacterium]